MLLEPGPGRLRGRPVGGPRDSEFRNLAAIDEYLDALASFAGCLAERFRAPAMKRSDHALDMLASTKTIDAMVDAPAGVGRFGKAAQFHLIGTAGSGSRTERAEEEMIAFDRLDFNDFGASAPAADRDFILVRGPPPLRSHGS